MFSKAIHFAFGTDADYVKYAGVLMTNLVHQHIGRPLCFHLAVDKLQKHDKERLDQFTALYRDTRIFIYQSEEIINRLNLPSHEVPPRLNRSVFLRILLPRLMPEELERVIYLDVDMLCLGRLDQLWELDLRGKPIAALETNSDKISPVQQKLKSGRYFNAGLLVIDLAQWRSQNLTERVIKCYQSNTEKLLMLEQDALNLVLDGNFAPLPEKFNRQLEANNPLTAVWQPEDLILHFVNEAKPWTKGCLLDIFNLYWHNVRLSLWNDMEPLEPTTVKAGFLAGKNAEARGDHKEAAYYFGLTASRLMEYYLYESEPKNREK